MVLDQKAKIIIHLECQSHGWLNYPSVIAGRGCRTNCESEPGCRWINQLYLSFLRHPFLPALASTLPPTPRPPALSSTHTHTHTQTSPQGCQGDSNVILNCCHLCWASTSEKGREMSDIKNKYVDCSAHRLRGKDRSREVKTGWKEKETRMCYCWRSNIYQDQAIIDCDKSKNGGSQFFGWLVIKR